jgi:hypothetical protein
MKQQFKSEVKIMEYEFERVPKELIEKRFILNFFESLPIEDLKRLINYKEINFNNKDLWNESPRMREKLNELRYERVILLTADVWLDNGIDDLSLGQI